MTRTIIYARVSTEDQVERYGLPAQLRACREYAAAHDLQVIEELSDEGISGTILDRPALNRVRQLAKERQVEVILMLDADRLSRELAHLLILKPEIERYARLEFVTAKFEDSPSGRMFFGIRGVIAQYERELTRERTMRGKWERAREGLIVGGRTAYGYRYLEGRLEPDPQQAETVRSIFAWYDAGQSIRSIAVKLRAQGVAAARGRLWGHSSVRRILINETYAGIAHYGTHRREGKVLRLRQPGNRISISVPALIDKEQWNRVQARLAENPSNGRPSNEFLLRGLLYCACGRRMAGGRTRNYRSYRCNGRDSLRHTGETCRCSVNARFLDKAVWSAVVSAFGSPDFLRDVLRQHQAELQAADPGDVTSLEATVRKCRSREETALSAMLDPDLSGERAAIKKKYLAAREERMRAEAEIARLNRNRSAKPSDVEWLEETAQLLEGYIRNIRTLEERQEFLRGVCTRADWAAGEVTLRCFVGAKLSTTSIRCGQFPSIEFTLKTKVAA